MDIDKILTPENTKALLMAGIKCKKAKIEEIKKKKNELIAKQDVCEVAILDEKIKKLQMSIKSNEMEIKEIEVILSKIANTGKKEF